MNRIVALFHIHQPNSHEINQDSTLKKLTDAKKRAESQIVTLVLSKSGQLLGEIDGNVAVSIPMESSEEIRNLYTQLKSENFKVTIGVGEDTKDALLALEYALKNNAGTIKVYSSEMEAQPDTEREPQTVAESTQDVVYKNEELNKQESMAIDDKTKDELRAILQVVGNNKDYFEQIKQQQPDLYAAITEVISSTAEMVHAAKEQHQKDTQKQMEKIVTALQNEREKALDVNEQDVVKELLNQQNDNDNKQKDKISQLYQGFKENYLNHHLMPSKPFVIHGGDDD